MVFFVLLFDCLLRSHPPCLDFIELSRLVRACLDHAKAECARGNLVLFRIKFFVDRARGGNFCGRRTSQPNAGDGIVNGVGQRGERQHQVFCPRIQSATLGSLFRLSSRTRKGINDIRECGHKVRGNLGPEFVCPHPHQAHLVLQLGRALRGFCRHARELINLFRHIIEIWQQIGAGFAEQVVHQRCLGRAVFKALQLARDIDNHLRWIAQLAGRILGRQPEGGERLVGLVGLVVEGRHALRQLGNGGIDIVEIGAGRDRYFLQAREVFNRSTGLLRHVVKRGQIVNAARQGTDRAGDAKIAGRYGHRALCHADKEFLRRR